MTDTSRKDHTAANAQEQRALKSEEQQRAGTLAQDKTQPTTKPTTNPTAHPSQHDLALKAMALKQAGEAAPNAMIEDGGPLHPHDPDASQGKGPLDEQARRTAPSGALDHAGELPSRERSRTRY